MGVGDSKRAKDFESGNTQIVRPVMDDRIVNSCRGVCWLWVATT